MWRRLVGAATSVLLAQEGQTALEYMLVIGTLSVALIAGLLGFDELIRHVVAFVCPSVDTAADPAATVGSCIGS